MAPSPPSWRVVQGMVARCQAPGKQTRHVRSPATVRMSERAASGMTGPRSRCWPSEHPPVNPAQPASLAYPQSPPLVRGITPSHGCDRVPKTRSGRRGWSDDSIDDGTFGLPGVAGRHVFELSQATPRAMAGTGPSTWHSTNAPGFIPRRGMKRGRPGRVGRNLWAWLSRFVSRGTRIRTRRCRSCCASRCRARRWCSGPDSCGPGPRGCTATTPVTSGMTVWRSSRRFRCGTAPGADVPSIWCWTVAS